MKKARRPWTAEAKARHKAGVKAYQEWRRMCELMDLLLQLSKLVKADPVDLGTTALAEKDRFKQIAEIWPAEERFKRLRELTVDTMQKIKSGIIPHPLVQG